MINRSFYFLRHGETDGNVQKVFHGRTDTLLNQNGQQQAALAGQILKYAPIDRLIVSPLKRVRETADIINKVLQKPLSYDDGLMERNYGIYEGLNSEQINAWILENNHDDGPPVPGTGISLPPQGEAYTDFKKRVVTTLNYNLDLYPDEKILFVCHGGIFNMLHFALFAEKGRTLNAHPYHFELKDGQWSLNCLVTQYEKEKTA